MYFEDIYNRIKPLWKESFSLERISTTKTYVKDISNNWDEIDNIVDFAQKEKYSEWESMLSFTMYQTLTAFALNKWNKNKSKILIFSEVPKALFEKDYRKNLKAEGNENFLRLYKGFKKYQ